MGSRKETAGDPDDEEKGRILTGDGRIRMKKIPETMTDTGERVQHMSVKIHVESLSDEYRRKLCGRALTRGTIDRLATEVSRKYLLQKKAFKWKRA